MGGTHTTVSAHTVAGWITSERTAQAGLVRTIHHLHRAGCPAAVGQDMLFELDQEDLAEAVASPSSMAVALCQQCCSHAESAA